MVCAQRPEKFGTCISQTHIFFVRLLKSIDDGFFLHQVSFVPTLSAKNTSCIWNLVRQNNFWPRNLLSRNQKPFKRKPFYTRNVFHQKTFTPETFYTKRIKKRLHQKLFMPMAHKLLHYAAFASETFFSLKPFTPETVPSATASQCQSLKTATTSENSENCRGSWTCHITFMTISI